MLLQLPEPLLLEIVSHLDAGSIRALCSTCSGLNVSACKTRFTGLTLDWKKGNAKLNWPKDAKNLKALHLVASKDHSQASEDKLGAFFRDVTKCNAETAQHVTSLHLKGWKMRQNNRQSPNMPQSMFRALPALTHLSLDRCRDYHFLFAKRAPWTQLRDLKVTYPTYSQNAVNEENIMDHIGTLTQLTRLSILVLDQHKSAVHVAPLSNLANLQQLELGVGCAFLMGMDSISKCCTQLSQLVFLHGNWDGGGSVTELGEELYWPHLKQAHVAVTTGVLPQLCLLPATAPQLQALHVYLTDFDGYEDSATDDDQDGIHEYNPSRTALQQLCDQPALQQPLVVNCSRGVCTALHSLRTLGGRLKHLVLSDISLRAVGTAGCILGALKELKVLKTLTLAGVKPGCEVVWEQVLLQQQQVDKVIIGISGEHAGYDRWRPLSKEAQMWHAALMRVLAVAAPGVAGGGAGIGATGGSKGKRGGRGKLGRGVVEGPNVDIYFGLWCPGSRVDHGGLHRVPAYLRLRKLSQDHLYLAATGKPEAAEPEAGSETAGEPEVGCAGGAGGSSAAAGQVEEAGARSAVVKGAGNGRRVPGAGGASTSCSGGGGGGGGGGGACSVHVPGSGCSTRAPLLVPPLPRATSFVTPALGRFRVRECPASSATDAVFSTEGPWLQPHLAKLKQLLDEPCQDCMRFGFVYEILPGDAYGLFDSLAYHGYEYSDDPDYLEEWH